MKYCSVDIETTGTDPEIDQILEIGAIFEDTNNLLDFNKIPKFKCIIEHEKYIGNAYAIYLNRRIFEILANIPKEIEDAIEYKKLHNILTLDNAAIAFTNFLNNNGIKNGYSAAGKNYSGFDNLFLKKVKNWPMPHQRVVDPGPMFLDFKKDWIIPNLETCKKRALLEDIEVTHNALIDAWDVVQVLRTKY